MPMPEMKITYGGPDKVQVLTGPNMQPAKCVLCGAPGDGRPFIDIGCYLDWYGTVYFCGPCIVDIANHLGYISPSQAAVVEDNLTRALSENHILAESNEHLRSIVSNLLNFGVFELNGFVNDYKEFIQWRDSQTSPTLVVSEGPISVGVNIESNEQRSSDVSDVGDDESQLKLGIDFSGVYSDGRSE